MPRRGPAGVRMRWRASSGGGVLGGGCGEISAVVLSASRSRRSPGRPSRCRPPGRRTWWPPKRACVTRFFVFGFAARWGSGLYRDDHAVLGVDRDLSAVHQVLAMPELVTQPCVRVSSRHGRRVGRHPLRSRPRSRLGQRKRRRRRALGRVRALSAVSLTGSDRRLGSQALQRRMLLDVRAHRRPLRPPAKPASVHCLSTALNSCSKTECKALVLRVTERQVLRQPSVSPNPKNRRIDMSVAATHAAPPASTATPPREHQRQPDQHRGIGPRAARAARLVTRKRRHANVLAIDQPLDPAQLVIARHQIVHQTIWTCRVSSR